MQKELILKIDISPQFREKKNPNAIKRYLTPLSLNLNVKRMQKCYDGIEISSNTDMIRKICKSLRKYQRFYESQSEKDKQPVQYYKGNISTVDIQTLDPKEWLNDQIMNRYLVMDLISCGVLKFLS